MNKTKITYTLNRVKYSHTFPAIVAYPQIETYLIMVKHIGLSQHAKINLKIQQPIAQLAPRPLNNAFASL